MSIDWKLITFQTKSVLVGLTVSLLLFPVFGGIGYWKAQNYAELVKVCEREEQLRAKAYDDIAAKHGGVDSNAASSNPFDVFPYYMCTQEGIRTVEYSLRTKSQSALYYADDGQEWVKSKYLAAVLILMILSVVPYAWRFFLRRLAELSRAIRGID